MHATGQQSVTLKPQPPYRVQLSQSNTTSPGARRTGKARGQVSQWGPRYQFWELVGDNSAVAIIQSGKGKICLMVKGVKGSTPWVVCHWRVPMASSSISSASCK